MGKKPEAIVTPSVMTIEMWPIERPIPYPKNARKWSADAILKVANSIGEFGWRQPIVCDAKDVIVIGHLRQAAARYLHLTEVPVHVAADLTPAQIKALRIADNRTHEEAEWDTALLGPELIDLKVENFDLAFTGFDDAEIIESVFGGSGKKKKSKGKKEDSPANGYKEQYGVIVVCDGEEFQQEVFEKLTAEGYNCRIVVT
jgi:hypothetical protein